VGVVLTNISVSKNRLAMGETGSITFTVKNTGTWTATELLMYTYCVNNGNAATEWYTLAVSIAKGASKTYTLPLAITTAAASTFTYYATRLLSLGLAVQISNGSDAEVGTAEIPGFMLTDMYYVPSIPIFAVSRSPNADSTGAAVDITCTLATGANTSYSGLALTLQWKEEGAASFPAGNTLAVTVADALATNGTTVNPSYTFEVGKAYTLRATFTDGIDSAFSEIKLSKAEKTLNVHPTSKNIGLGQFAVADLDADDVMRMDTVYRPYFHEGARDADGREIIGKTDYSATAVDTGIKWLNGRKIYRKTFIFGSMATSGSLDIPIGEAAIEEVVSLRGTVGTSGGAGLELLPFTHQATLNYQKGLTVSSLASNPTITIQMGSGAAAPVGGYVVIEYVPIDPATQWSKPYMTAASEAGCIVSASSEDSATNAALKGFSLSPTEYWASTLMDPDRWIQMQMPGGRTNIVLYICNHNVAATYPAVKAGTFYGSNNGSTWDALGTFNNRPDRQNFALTVHFLRNQTPYSYIRIKITSPEANVDKSRIGRISVFGDIA